MSLYILSDLHIEGPSDDVYRRLLLIIENLKGGADIFVLAGDVFDLFVGNREPFTSRYSEFIKRVKEAARKGVSIHYIEGNHDFFIRKVFSGTDNINIHSHDVSLNMDGKRFFLAHGDTVDRRNYGYRALRGFLRSPLMKLFVILAHGSLIDAIGKKSSARSRRKRVSRRLDFEKQRMIFRSFAAEKIKEGYDFVVMGHSHDLDEMTFKVNDRLGQYINTGFPPAHGSFLVWNSGDEKISRQSLGG